MAGDLPFLGRNVFPNPSIDFAKENIEFGLSYLLKPQPITVALELGLRLPRKTTYGTCRDGVSRNFLEQTCQNKELCSSSR